MHNTVFLPVSQHNFFFAEREREVAHHSMRNSKQILKINVITAIIDSLNGIFTVSYEKGR